MTRHHHYPRLYEIEEFSDYHRPDFKSPLVLCVVVLVTALIVFCVTKKMSGGRIGGGCGVCTSARAARNNEVTDGVVHAKDAKHLDELLNTDGCVVLFWAPWCGHCATFKPEFMGAAKEHTECLYVMVDCENAVGPEVLQKHGIEAFPTTRYYKNGSMKEEYQGPREKDALKSWAASKA